VKQVLYNTAALGAERAELQSEMAIIVTGMIQQCVDENAHVTQDQEKYQQRCEALAIRFDTAKRRFEDVSYLLADIEVRRDKTDAFIKSLRKQSGVISEFDEHLWYSLIVG
jgi:site-specific DNA recombinase